jgi:hypothetical protein
LEGPLIEVCRSTAQLTVHDRWMQRRQCYQIAATDATLLSVTIKTDSWQSINQSNKVKCSDQMAKVDVSDHSQYGCNMVMIYQKCYN